MTSEAGEAAIPNSPRNPLWHDGFVSTRAWRASYVRLARSGELAVRAADLRQLMHDCTMCPRSCHVDRGSELGDCSTGIEAAVASWNPHFGEEPVISSRRGSGTVFMANCNLSCVFCQNHDISQRPSDFAGRSTTAEELAAIFIELQDRGCHNINWVSPSHQVSQLVGALQIAAGMGLTLPVVYNSNGYDAVETLELLDGIVDIYMPDLKYSDPNSGCRLSGVERYPEHARAALAEMHRQTAGSWRLGPEGELQRGLLIRMLVLPDNLAGIEASLKWIATTLSPRVAISLLAQYRPAHRVHGSQNFAAMRRGITSDEWRQAVKALETHMAGDRHHVQGAYRNLKSDF
jgi:putative pyruvate formate lyase activating enzyme